MSFFETRCLQCGESYWTGVVGTTLMGMHECAYEGFWPLVLVMRFWVLMVDEKPWMLHELPPGTFAALTLPG